MAANTAKRIKFVKAIEAHEFADVRYDVLLDGEKIGQVTGTVENVETSASALSTSRTANYRSAKVWRSEGERRPMGRESRNDAAIDLLETAKGMSYAEAMTVLGVRGW